MTQNVALNKGQTAIEPFFDAIQELLGAAAPHFRVVPVGGATPATLRVPGATGNDQSSIAINGLYRFRTTDIDATAAGVAATYDLYVTASNNNFTGPPEDLDFPTDYNFGFTIRAVGLPPVGVDQYRKVGEVDWDGTAITAIRQWVGSRRDDAPVHAIAGLPTISPLRGKGAALQTAPLLRLDNSAGAAVFSINNLGQVTNGVTITHTDGVIVTADGGKDTINLSSTAANVGITIGADTNLYRPAADTLRTDDALQSLLGVMARQGAAAQVEIGAKGPAAQAGIALGLTGDTTFYRDVAGTWRTPGSIVVDGSLTVGGGTIIGVGSTAGGDLSGTFSNLQIGAGVVGATELATDAVTNVKVANDAINTAEIANLAVTGPKIGLLAVSAAQIANNTITAAEIAADAITSSELGSLSVATAKIIDLAVTTAKINDLAVTNAKLAASAVDASKIAANAVTNAAMADDAIGTAELLTNAVTNVELRDDPTTDLNRSVTTDHIRDLAVTGAKIAAGAVTTAKIGTDTILAGNIAADAIGTSELAPDAVTTAEMAVDSVGASEIIAGAVGTAELADGSVLNAKIANLAVDAAKIAANTITANKIAPDAITASELALNAVGASELQDNAVDTAAIQLLAVTTGTIANDAVTNAKIGPDAVTGVEIANDSVTATEIATSAVGTTEIADLSVTTTELALDAVTEPKIAVNAVGTGQLIDANVTLAKLAVAVQEALIPTGTILATARGTAPSGFVMCDGTGKNTTTFATLFAAIGYTYGGSGTTFNVPDLRGRVPVGVDGAAARIAANDTLSDVGGAETVTLTGTQSGVPAHSHTVNISTSVDGNHAHNVESNLAGQQVYYDSPSAVGVGAATGFRNLSSAILYVGPTDGQGSHGHSVNGSTANNSVAGAGAPHNNLQPYQIVNWIIKL